ncbi:MAG: J domain-containing protein [bacterium]|nr:J domain-containing protein [bacterium]
MQKRNPNVPVFVVEVDDLVFRAPSERFPQQRLATVETEHGEITVYPCFVFNPLAGKGYPCRVKVFELAGGRLHGVAAPSSAAVLTLAELTPAMQSSRTVVFEADEDRLTARDPKTGMYVVPAGTWATEMKGIYRDAKTPISDEDAKPKAGSEYRVMCEELPNKLVAHPTPPPELGASSTALEHVVEASGVRSEFEAVHVLSADGKQWMHFRDVLRLADGELNEASVKAAFRKQSAVSHPDKFVGKSAAVQLLAKQKFELVKRAFDQANAWLTARAKAAKEPKAAEATPTVVVSRPARGTTPTATPAATPTGT